MCSIAAMQFLRRTGREELILAWLGSEHPDSQLVDDPDLTDRVQNAARKELLYRDRGKILQEVPDQVPHMWVGIEESDLPKLCIVPCAEWFLDTGGTFRLIDTPAHLKGGRGVRWAWGIASADHLAKVDAIAQRLADYDAVTTDEVLIIIAANKVGPYSIIDGTHRAAALYRNYLAKPNMPWKGILAVDPAIAECQWHIESEKAQKNLAQLKLDAELGALW